jgi:glutathione S-transferase
MKFYDCATAPSPRRVRIFLAEKGISVPTVQVDLRNGEHLREPFRKINPEATVPALELDDGTVIGDAIAICAYFEEVHPEPPLIGRTARERAVTIAWNRRVERNCFYAAMEAFRNATPGLKGRALPGPDNYEQIPALAERGRERLARFYAWMDARLAGSPFVAGEKLFAGRHHHADHRRVRQVGEDAGAGELPASPALVRGGERAAEREGLSRPAPHLSPLCGYRFDLPPSVSSLPSSCSTQPSMLWTVSSMRRNSSSMCCGSSARRVSRGTVATSIRLPTAPPNPISARQSHDEARLGLDWRARATF